MKRKIVECGTGFDECPLCGAHLVKKYNCNPKRLVTLEGEIYPLERVKRCSNPECEARDWSFRSEDLQAMTFWRRIYALDIIAYIAKLKYERRMTHDEILEELHSRGITISRGNITHELNFVEALARGWHEENLDEIKKRIKEQGGYILSIDGTYSYKGKTLYIFRDVLSGSALYAETAIGGKKEDVKPLLERVLEMFGRPRAVISDMQPSIIEAVEELLPGVKHQYCQYHFLGNVGKGLMADGYGELRRAVKGKKVKGKVKRAAAREKKGAKILSA